MKKPFFSIIIPTRNRESQLRDCLRSIASLDYPPDRFEVIVVDDGSDQPPDQTVAVYTDTLRVTLITQENGGPASARNTGAAAAQGPYLAFTDDDCRPDPSWLRSLSERFTRFPDCCIGGRSINALPYNLFSTTSQLLIEYLFEYYNRVPDKARFLTSNNLTMPKHTFFEIGGFDTSFPNAAAEDREFCDRWLLYGHPIRYAPEVLIHHAHPLAFRMFWRQHYNYGSSAFRFHHIRALRSKSGIHMEPLSFYLDLLKYPFRTGRGIKTFLLAGLMALTQTANALGFLNQKIQFALRRNR